jgi:hypothetical protein
MDSINEIKSMLEEMELFTPKINNNNQIDILVNSVNIERLKNNPIQLDKNDLRIIYLNCLKLNK